MARHYFLEVGTEPTSFLTELPFINYLLISPSGSEVSLEVTDLMQELPDSSNPVFYRKKIMSFEKVPPDPDIES